MLTQPGRKRHRHRGAAPGRRCASGRRAVCGWSTCLTTSRRRGPRGRQPLPLLVTVPLGAAALVVALVACWLAYVGVRLAWMETAARKQAAPAGGRWLRAGDTDIHVREWGPPGLVRRWCTAQARWSGTWVSNVQAMRAAGYRVVALDLPPFGFNSSRPMATTAARRRRSASSPWRNSSAAARVLLGHSFGPADRPPRRPCWAIEHLVLVDAAIGLQEEAGLPCAAPGGPANLLAWPGLRTLLMKRQHERRSVASGCGSSSRARKW